MIRKVRIGRILQLSIVMSEMRHGIEKELKEILTQRGIMLEADCTWTWLFFIRVSSPFPFRLFAFHFWSLIIRATRNPPVIRDVRLRDCWWYAKDSLPMVSLFLIISTSVQWWLPSINESAEIGADDTASVKGPLLNYLDGSKSLSFLGIFF